jgi:hypothetical protein
LLEYGWIENSFIGWMPPESRCRPLRSRNRTSIPDINVRDDLSFGKRNHYIYIIHTACSHRGCLRMDAEDLLLFIAVLVILFVALYGISVPILSALGT